MVPLGENSWQTETEGNPDGDTDGGRRAEMRDRRRTDGQEGLGGRWGCGWVVPWESTIAVTRAKGPLHRPREYVPEDSRDGHKGQESRG